MARVRNRTKRKGANGLKLILVLLATGYLLLSFAYLADAQRVTPTPINTPSQPPFCNITPEPTYPGELD